MGNTQSQQSSDEDQDTQSCYSACFSRLAKDKMKAQQLQRKDECQSVPKGEPDDTPNAETDHVDGAVKNEEKVQSHPEKVKVYGPGICEGRVGEKGVFTIETADAGPGQMSVRVLGPKKSIVVSQMPHPTIDYAIIVEYNPTNAGSYVIEVEWSGTHVSGSPFTVNVVDGTEIIYHGTITPYKDFIAEKDAAVLQKSIADPGNGIDEKAIIDILSSRSNEQRLAIKKYYEETYGKDVAKEYKSLFTGNMRRCVFALLCPRDIYDATSLRKAMKSFKKKPEVVMEIICTRSSQDIHMIKEAYSTAFSRNLEKDIASEFSGQLKNFLVTLCQVVRESAAETVNEDTVKEDVRKLSSSSEGLLDEDTVIETFTTRSYPHLKAMLDQYARVNQIDFLDALDSGISGNLKKGVKVLVNYIRIPHAYFAERLWESIKGVSLDDKSLIRIIVTRSEIDLVEVLKSFQQQYQKPLTKVIDEVTNGSYRRLILTIMSTK